MRALEFITSQPWLITEAALAEIVSIVERRAMAEKPLDIDTLMTREGRRLQNSRTVEMLDGVAIIPVTGPIFRYANLFTEISGGTSTQVLATDFRTALDDPLVHSILLDVNSPGGTASGIHELANMIFDARGRKPLAAYGGGQVASAAYWIASAVDPGRFVVDAISPVGSIGAKLSIIDTSQRDAKAGVRQIEIVSSQSPDKVLDVNQDEGRAKVQKIVDDLAGVFVEAVARHRGVTSDTVLADYGRGGMMVGQAAVDAGLADRLGSLDSVLQELAAARDPQRRSFIMAATNSARGAAKGPITVSTTAELVAAVNNGHTVEEISIKSIDVEALKAEGHAAGVEAGKAELAAATTKAATDATAAERKRVLDLQGIAMKGFEPEIQKAIASGATVEATAVEVTKLARTRGTNLATQQADAPGAVHHGGADAAAGGKKSWDKVKGRMNKKAQAKA